MPYLIVGLGNPGAEYEQTRHNIGFMLIDQVAREVGRDVKRSECRALVGTGDLEGQRVEFVKPQTYMNLSGESVACLLKKRPTLKPSDVIVISDDLAIPFGSVRLRSKGSSGGHNGLKNLIAQLKTDEFIRLRVGIKPDHPVTGDTARFVLDRFPPSTLPQLQQTLDLAAQALRMVVSEGLERAMANFN